MNRPSPGRPAPYSTQSSPSIFRHYTRCNTKTLQINIFSQQLREICRKCSKPTHTLLGPFRQARKINAIFLCTGCPPTSSRWGGEGGQGRLNLEPFPHGSVQRVLPFPDTWGSWPGEIGTTPLCSGGGGGGGGGGTNSAIQDQPLTECPEYIKD